MKAIVHVKKSIRGCRFRTSKLRKVEMCYCRVSCGAVPQTSVRVSLPCTGSISDSTELTRAHSAVGTYTKML